jgi:cytochrome c oxidase assembly factor CtaG
MLQHLLIGDLAPLLLLLGLSRVIMRPATRRLTSLERSLGALANPLTALVAWVLLLYVWHLPGLYDAALASPLLHALEHTSFFLGGLLLWWPLIQPVPMRRQAAGLWPFAYITGAKVAGGVLGLLLVWSSALVYEAYATAPQITSLTPLEDQKAGGALMMTEQSIVLFAVFFILFIRMLGKSEEDQLRRDRLEDERVLREQADDGLLAPAQTDGGSLAGQADGGSQAAR